MKPNSLCICSFSLVLYTTLPVSYTAAITERLVKRFSKKEICRFSETTLETVNSCPTIGKTIQERSRKKNCQRYRLCQGDPLVYHCVRYNEILVEVCAPQKIIIGQCCTEFSRGVGRVVEDYNTPCSECPFRYQSDESSKYSTCTNVTTVTSANPCNGHKGYDGCDDNLFESTPKDRLPQRPLEENTSGKYIIYIVVVLTITVGGLIVFLKYKHEGN